MPKTSIILGTVPQYKGEYSAENTYYKDNIVVLDGVAYICITDEAIDSDPRTLADWEPLAGSQQTQVYEEGGVYVLGQLVSHQGVLYRVTVNVTTTEPSVHNADYQPVTAPFCVMTEEEYESLAVKDSSTFYFIFEDDTDQ